LGQYCGGACGFFADGVGDLDGGGGVCAGGGRVVLVLAYEVVGEGGVEEFVYVEVLLDEGVVALVILPSKMLSAGYSSPATSHTHIGFFIFFSSASVLK
jgi:hypothetical protein